MTKAGGVRIKMTKPKKDTTHKDTTHKDTTHKEISEIIFLDLILIVLLFGKLKLDRKMGYLESN